MTWYVIDGMDGSGKTTSSDIVREHLQASGRKVLEITHPNTNCLAGRMAAKALRIPGKLGELLTTLLYILDVLHSLNYKKWHQKYYDDVIFVRYSMAAAYVPESMCKTVYRMIEAVLPVPDVKIFVDIDPQIAMKRILDRGEELEIFETDEKLNSTRRRMLSIADTWHVVDNSGTVENTRQQTLAVLEEVGAR